MVGSEVRRANDFRIVTNLTAKSRLYPDFFPLSAEVLPSPYLPAWVGFAYNQSMPLRSSAAWISEISV
jgi:hypothetical protein